MKGNPLSPFTGVLVLFVSTVLVVFGCLTLTLTFWPIFAQEIWQAEQDIYFADLPLAPDRLEPFEDVNSVPPKQLFPPLRTSLTDVAPGNWIRIPSLGIAVPLVLSESIEDSDVITALQSGAALYPNGIEPGRLGNAFISAHSTGQPWKGKFRFAFLEIDKVQPDSVIHVDYEGTRYSYRLAEKKIVTPTPDFRVISDRPVPTITLMACWPLWSTSQRMLLTGELTNITKI